MVKSTFLCDFCGAELGYKQFYNQKFLHRGITKEWDMSASCVMCENCAKKLDDLFREFKKSVLTQGRQKMTDLKPCPFCGKEMIITDGQSAELFGFWHIEKSFDWDADCPFYIGGFIHAKSREKAIEAWNRRACDE